MTTNTWRKRARAVIAQTLEGVATTDPVALRRLLFDAYPFGPRRYYPYRVWCEEVKRAIGRRSGIAQQQADQRVLDHPWVQAARARRAADPTD